MDVTTTQSVTKILNKTNGAMIRSAGYPKNYTKMSVTPDFTKALIWNEYSQVIVVRISDLSNITQWIPPGSTSVNATDKITISLDSSLAIIELDHFNSIYILDLNNFYIKHSYRIMNTDHED